MQRNSAKGTKTVRQDNRAELRPKPYFQRHGITLYHGDSLQILPQLSDIAVDATITDPPYSSGGQTTGERTRDPRDKYCQDGNDQGRPSFKGDTRDQRSLKFWLSLILSHCLQLSRESAYALVFCDWRQSGTMADMLQAAGYVWRGTIAWDKGRGARAPHKGYFRHQCEYVQWGTSGRCEKAEHAGPFDGCVHEAVRQSDKHHMTGKPTNLMLQLVECVPPGSLILDPFAGSGTTGVACAMTGRKFVGIEQSEEYCEIAAKRLEEALANMLAMKA